MQKRSSQSWDGRFFVYNRFTIRNQKEKKMDTQTETKLADQVTETPRESENPMQERHCGEVAESVEVAAETVFAARRLEVREEAGPVFVP
jgi:predicted sulfurtransferase